MSLSSYNNIIHPNELRGIPGNDLGGMRRHRDIIPGTASKKAHSRRNDKGRLLMTDRVRLPRQQRSIQTRKRIARAAFSLFAQKGIHGTNSKEIAAKAGVSIGSFYAYFKDKKQLLLEILDDTLDKVYRTVWQDLGNYAVEALRPEDIKSIIENVFKAYDIAPRFLSQAHVLRYSDPDINRAFERERQREIAQIMKLMELNRAHLHIRDSYAAAVIIQNAAESVAHTAKYIGTEIDEERLIDELAAMVFGHFLSGARKEAQPTAQRDELQASC